jgi:hypothetical protein
MHTHRHKPTTQAHALPARPATPPAVPTETNHDAQRVSADDIRLRAYRKWENAGKPTGDGVPFWLEAEQELMRGE